VERLLPAHQRAPALGGSPRCRSPASGALREKSLLRRALVGFEWSERPTARYGPNETILIEEYTALPGKANTGHTYDADLCPDTAGLHPIADRKEIEERVLGSRVRALLAYLKAL